MTFGSLFAGIGGMDLGLERAGMQCKWQVEIDPYARKVLAKHWPDVRRHDDVRTFPVDDGTDWSVDLIAGGFPCQDISYAGKGAGLQGERSGLWYEFARIIRDVRPRFVLVENVAALLVRGLDDVLGTLASLGYDAEWSSVSACEMGAPHMRQRVFIVANRSRVYGKPNGSVVRREVPFGIRDWWQSEPGLVRVVNGVPGRMVRLKVIGNAVVPQVAEFIGRRIIESSTQGILT